MLKSEYHSKNRRGKREFLNHAETTELTKQLYRYFETKVEAPRIKHGYRQTLENLIN